jgi:hypothetical protein
LELSISKKELIVILSLGSFALIWTVFVMTYFSNWIWFQNQAPPIQFLLFESGYMIVFTAFIGVPVSYLLSGRKKIVQAETALKIGLGSWSQIKL